MRQTMTHRHTASGQEPGTAVAPPTDETPHNPPRPRGAHRTRPAPNRKGAHRRRRPPHETPDRGLAATQFLALPVLGLLLLLAGENTISDAPSLNQPTQASSSTTSHAYPTGTTLPPADGWADNASTPPAGEQDGTSPTPATSPTAAPPTSTTAASEPGTTSPPAAITTVFFTWKPAPPTSVLTRSPVTTTPTAISTVRATPKAAPSPTPTPSPPPVTTTPTDRDSQSPFPIITLTEKANCETISIAATSLTATVTQNSDHIVLTVFGTYTAPADTTTSQVTIHTTASAATNSPTAVRLAETATTVQTEPASTAVPLASINLDQLTAAAPAVFTLTLGTAPTGCAPVTLTNLTVVLLSPPETSPAAPSTSETASP